ncbi:DUF3944 domain-containing protein [Campylobacter coli]|nr:DUF3944 domain-containing protein [Campylobacter coli]
MAYKVDNDLEFLRELNDESLDNLVSILIKDENGKTRTTESLTDKDLYKKHYPNHGLDFRRTSNFWWKYICK